jgi:hypothetical protein
MATIYAAVSKANQAWAADVGLGKSVYKLGVVDGQTPEQALAGFAGQTDWVVLASDDTDIAEADALERLGRKEKAVDPNYYPKLRGAQGLFKVNLTGVENSMLVALALDGRETKNLKVKPADIGRYLIANAVR